MHFFDTCARYTRSQIVNDFFNSFSALGIFIFFHKIYVCLSKPIFISINPIIFVDYVYKSVYNSILRSFRHLFLWITSFNQSGNFFNFPLDFMIFCVFLLFALSKQANPGKKSQKNDGQFKPSVKIYIILIRIFFELPVSVCMMHLIR
jgi:hypothetical protein